MIAGCAPMRRTKATALAAGVDDAPSYNAGTDTLILDDNLDSYTSFADAIAGGWRSKDDLTTQDTDAGSSGANQIITGRSGSGKALRLAYNGGDTGSGQEVRAWSHPFSDANGGKAAHTLFIEYYCRFTMGGGHSLDVDRVIAIKFIELYTATTGGGVRVQFNTHSAQLFNMVPAGFSGGTATLFQIYDTNGAGGGATPGQSTQLRGPYMRDLATQWFKVNIEFRCNSGSGARDGSARLWINGTLVCAVRADYVNVVVPNNDTEVNGNNPYWCTTADLDAISTDTARRKMTLGSVMTATLVPFDMDLDDVLVWRRPYP